MDRIVIETEATSAFKAVIRRNPYLFPYIDENDKTPVWDGSVYVYSAGSTNKTNKTLLGRVPTQIKGHNTKIGFPNEISFQLKKTDLLPTLSEGGIFFIVVYIDNDFNTQIYYEQLLSLDIERLLAEMKNKQSKKISLRSLPSDSVQMANLFLNFIENRKKQMGTVDSERLDFSNWADNIEIDAFRLHISTFSNKKMHPFQALSSSPNYLYAKPKHFDLEIPMERFNELTILSDNMHEIGCNNKVYFSKKETKSIWESGNLHIEFGRLLTLYLQFLPEYKVTGKFHFELRGMLNELVNISDFILAVHKHRSITVNGINMKLTLDDGLEDLESYFNFLIRIREKLNDLKITTDLNLVELNHKIFRLLVLLLEINEDVEDIYLEKKNQISVLEISNIQLTILSIEKENKFYVNDFFFMDEKWQFGWQKEDGQQLPVSRFLLLKEKALCSSNLFAEQIYFDLIKYETGEDYRLLVNLFLLECLKAYDSSLGNSKELLKLSNYIINWLEMNDPGSIIYKLNYWQIKLRERELNDEEITSIKAVSTDNAEPWNVRCGAMILLGHFEGALNLLEQQTKKEQDEFKTFPIYFLMKKNNA